MIIMLTPVNLRKEAREKPIQEVRWTDIQGNPAVTGRQIYEKATMVVYNKNEEFVVLKSSTTDPSTGVLGTSELLDEVKEHLSRLS